MSGIAIQSGMLGSAAGGATPPSIVFTDSYLDADNPSTLTTFAGANLGTSENKLVVVTFGSRDDDGGEPDYKTATIGGVAMTSVIQHDAEKGTQCMYQLETTQSVADIVVNHNDTFVGGAISVYAIYGLSSITPTATASVQTSTPSISVPAGGFAILLTTNRDGVVTIDSGDFTADVNGAIVKVSSNTSVTTGHHTNSGATSSKSATLNNSQKAVLAAWV